MTPRAKSLLLFLPHLDMSGGLGVHCRMLLAALSAVPSSFDFTVVCPTDPQSLFPTTGMEKFDRNGVDAMRFHFREIAIPGGYTLANPLDAILEKVVADANPDLIYCSYYTGMEAPPCPQILTFHDAGFLENPAGFGATAEIRRRTLTQIAPAISLIHCISHDAQERICRLLPWPRDKTAVVWHALPDSAEVLANAISSLRSADDGLPYFFLPVGAATGFNRVRKNVPNAIRAFQMLPAGSARLIIAGTAKLTGVVLTELLPATLSGIVSCDCWESSDKSIRIVPTIERNDFLAAMRHAVAVVYSSRYEGFGLPTLEAMALGVPLIACRATSIPEIVGDAGLLVDPDDLVGFRDAMEQILKDPAMRADLIRRGEARVQQFTVSTMGTEMIRCFDSV